MTLSLRDCVSLANSSVSLKALRLSIAFLVMFVGIVSCGRSADVNDPSSSRNMSSGVASSSLRSQLIVQRSQGDAASFVVFIGDSLTKSWHASSFENGFRPLIVSSWSTEGRIDSVVHADVGATIASVVASKPDVPERTSLVVIELGSSDIVGGTSAVPAFRANYSDLLAGVSAASPDAAILCLGTWSRGNDGVEFDRVIQDLCSGVGRKYLTLSDIYESTNSRGPVGREVYPGSSPGDSFHPNDFGYMLIANRILENTYLSERLVS